MIGSKVRSLALALLFALGLGACSGGPVGGGSVPTAARADGAAAQVLATPAYKLGSGDRLKVTVFRHEDLSGEFSLDGTGTFGMPLVGEIDAAGLTNRELEQRIVEKLREGELIREPQVSVEVLNYRPFYILGEVKTPGAYPYQNNMNVLNGVVLAGGFTTRAFKNDFVLQRGGSNSPPVRVPGDTQLLPGDIVTVQERFF